MTINDKLSQGPKTLTWQELQAMNFAFDSPFQLRLTEGQLFSAEKIVRLVPKKRLVAFGTWQGKAVVAKLFFDAHHAKRHREKDQAGVTLLQENKIPTPALYYQGKSEDKRIHVLIFERIIEAENLESVWRDKKSADDVLPLLQSVIIELATQHVLGVRQQDLHLKNFLLTEKTIYTLDGGQVELFPYILPKKPSMNSLALFLSQLGVGVESTQEKLFRHYCKARGWRIKQDDVMEIVMLIKKWNEQRWERFEKKIFRNCSDFARLHNLRTLGMYDRSYALPEFIAFLAHPESAFQHESMTMLKAGRSATVIKVKLDQHEFVVKRYNMKNLWHRMRRCLRPTRAWSSWRLAQKLNLFGIPVAKPAAFIEKRYVGLRGISYYITEYVPGEHAGKYFLQHNGAEEKTTSMVKHIAALLKSIAKLEITHGDLKATNILITPQDKPIFIDLDGTAEHASLSSLHNAWKKEIKRFLENFHDQPQLCEKFKVEL